MPYTVKSSEKLRKSGAENETKALLYLMSSREDSKDIYYFVVDFFNDLTGMDSFATSLWDVQSKGAHNVSPKAVGKDLVTLFKNFVSGFNFKAYILFIGSVSASFRKDSSQAVFGIDNVSDVAIKSIKEGLLQEGKAKEYIDDASLTDVNVSAFIKNVLFVIDGNKRPSEYVKAIIAHHPKIIPEDEILEAIFNEIRDKQSSKKNISTVEGVVINTPDEAINFCRHLTSTEIRLMILQRIITRNPLGKGIVGPFIPIYNLWPPESRQEKLEECQSALCRALFNKNATDGFWSLFEEIKQLIVDHPNENVQQLFTHLQLKGDYLTQCPDLDVISVKYLIAIVKDGIQE